MKKKKNGFFGIAAAYLAAGLMLGVIFVGGALSVNAEIPEGCGDPIGEYRGVPACGVGEQWQCVEYVDRFYRQEWQGNGNEYYGKALEFGLRAYPNGGTVVPQADDILCFSGGLHGYGHVAIIRGINDDTIDIIEQNWDRNEANKSIPWNKDTNKIYDRGITTIYTVQGWLRSPNTWYFETAGDTENWEAHNVDSYSVEDGKYFIDPAGSNPNIQIDRLLIDATTYNTFLINVSSKCEDIEAAVYFKTTTSPEYGEDKKIPFEISNGRAYDPYFVFIEDQPLWRDMITGIRIQPASEGISGDDSDIVAFESIEMIQTIYVPDDYPTIQAAVDSALKGDRIIVKSGVYEENIDISTDRLTIESINGADFTVVQAADPDDDVFEITADYVDISGFTVTGAIGGYTTAGFYLLDGDYCNILCNIVLNNDCGIRLFSSNNNTISDNSVNENNHYGIQLSSSNDNTISDNSANDNYYYGIRLSSSNNNTISGNSANENQWSIDLDYSDSNILFGNTVSGNAFGIILYYSNSNNIKGNNAYNNQYGISISNSDDNTITENNAFYNEGCSIRVRYSNDNEIYRNNFIYYYVCSFDSTNIWNSTEKIIYTYNGNTYENYLGNYYSHYTNIDANSDGIWDNPYSINQDKDYYPLTESFDKYQKEGFSSMEIKAFCPVNLSVADPDGLVINPETNEIQGASYAEEDISGDGDPDDIISIPNRKTGSYKITVIPEPDAESTDTYTLEVSANDTTIVLAENVSISDIPQSPYEIESNETGINIPPAPPIYVPDDYPTIQAAVNAAIAGDTIIVRQGTYTENVKVEKQLALIGEDQAIVESASMGGFVFKISNADNVSISGFRITGENHYAGISLYNSENSRIENVVISNSGSAGIRILNSGNNTIENCTINSETGYGNGIYLYFSENTIITGNTIEDNYRGIYALNAPGSEISSNEISDSGKQGICLYESENSKIIGNTISGNNREGAYLILSHNSSICQNNFIGNEQNAYEFARESPKSSWDNGEKGNYWDDYTGIDSDSDGIGDTPYMIYSVRANDSYPLMEPWEA